MHQVKALSRIAKMRSGRFIEVPHDLTTDNRDAFLKKLSADEFVDILCITEYLNLKFFRESPEGVLRRSMERINEALRKNNAEPNLEVLLNRLGLNNSIDYVRFGEILVEK